MNPKSHAGAGRTKSANHLIGESLQALAHRVFRPRFLVPFVAVCGLVYLGEVGFEKMVESGEDPIVVQGVFHLTGLYQWLVTGLRYPIPRYTAVVEIDRDKEPGIPNDQEVCRQREALAKLILRVHSASPAVIVVDKYFGIANQCPSETDILRSAIRTATADTAVIVGRGIDDVNFLSTESGDSYFLMPSVDFGIQSPRFQEGILNLDPDTRKIPLVWDAYESKEQAETSGDLPQWYDTLALQASQAYPGELLRRNGRIVKFFEYNQNPFASFIEEQDFETVPAGSILPVGAAAGTMEAPLEPLPEAQKKQFTGRVVLIGELDRQDNHLTVVGRMPGLLLQANYVEALLDDRVFRPMPLVDYVFGFVILTFLELSLIVFRGKWVWLILAVTGIILCSLIVLFLFVRLFGWYVDPAPLVIVPSVTKILGSFFGPVEDRLVPPRPSRGKKPRRGAELKQPDGTISSRPSADPIHRFPRSCLHKDVRRLARSLFGLCSCVEGPG